MNPPINLTVHREMRPLRQPTSSVLDGAIAQLVERLHGMQEVGGSIPPGSTKFFKYITGMHLAEND